MTPLISVRCSRFFQSGPDSLLCTGCDGLPPRLRRSRGVRHSLGLSLPQADGLTALSQLLWRSAQVNRQVEAAMVATAKAKRAFGQDMPAKTHGDAGRNVYGGLCLVTMDPDSNCIILEQLAQARDQTSGMRSWHRPWHAQLSGDPIDQ